MDIVKHNSLAWDSYVEQNNRWTVPVTGKEISEAREGKWKVVLTPEKAVPRDWFPLHFEGLNILGLASGGGQQCPILASLGAQVTVFDNSGKQLSQDQKVSDEFSLGIKTVKGDMKDLSCFADESFDLIFNPCSIAFIDEAPIVWEQCSRVLKKGGVLMTGLINPIYLQLAEDNFNLVHKQPYSDLYSLPKEELDKLKKNMEPLIYGHSLTDLIGAQLKVGLQLTDLYEDYWGNENEVDKWFPSFIATRSIKK